MDNIIKKLQLDLQLRGLSPVTQREYSLKVEAFQNFFKKPATELGEKEIRIFLHHLINEKKLNPCTINTYNSALRFLYGVTLEKDLNYKRIPRLKEPRILPDILTMEEIQSLFNATSNLKHKCILMTVYGSGLRLSEVAKLKVMDIDSKNMRILIRQGKGGKDRYAILSQANLEILREYWKKCRPSHWLFEGREKDSHISKRAIQDMFSAARERANIKKDVSIHTLRHCFATHLLEADTNIFHIKQLMGHSNIRTTARYLHLANIEIMNTKSPLDSLKGNTND